MIYKNATLGEKEDVTVVQFGTGDIHICGLDSNEDNLYGVLFSQSTEKDISEWDNVDDPITDINETKDPVVLYFSNIESLEQVIKSLEEVRSKF